MDTETTVLSAELQEGLSELAQLPESANEIDDYLRKLLLMLEKFAVTYGGKLIGAIVLLIVGFKIVNVSMKKAGGSKALSRMDNSTRGFMQSLVGILLKVIICMTALGILGIPMSTMIAVIGSCGLAVGLALQGSLANIAGGFIILVLRPFSTGDYIITDSIEGTVEDIGIFHTKIITVDNKRITVPNSTISNATLVNASAFPERRVDLKFTAAYNADIEKVERVLKETCEKHELALRDKPVFARLSAHLDSALEYTVRVWCKTEDYWTLYFDLLRDVKIAFDENGIEIPFPQLDIHKD